ncbi:hypothetical protein [Brevibacillus sp. SYSU BS000544]|uniref:hypothetical protein n=1 Tax=Brevibacillus sp. SYSU BS000544 TaxID=3416443 RepID=UPI003CE560FF
MENKKYPDNYFEHYIVCFSTGRHTSDEAGFEKLARLYIDIEGVETFSELIKEIKCIYDNNDWSYFESIIKQFEIEDLDIDKIKEMAAVALRIFKEI